MSKSIKHILVIRFSAMGDVAMTVPVLRALTNQHPHIKITVLTRGDLAPLFRDVPNVKVYAANLQKEHKGIYGLYKLSRELKRLNFDVVADLHNVLRTHILKVYLSSVNWVRIDKGRPEKKALVSGKAFKQLKTNHQRYADVFINLGFDISLESPVFPQPKLLNDNALRLIGNKNKKRIGIAPFAAHDSKMYPLDLMQKVIESLSKRYEVVLFGGGKNEKELLEAVEHQFENVKNVTGKLSFDEELDVISTLDIMLSMDSGNGHLAATLGITTVTLWGVTHPFAGFYPFHQDSAHALLADRTQFPKIPTSVYGNKFPDGYQNAIRTITPQQIVDKIDSLL